MGHAAGELPGSYRAVTRVVGPFLTKTPRMDDVSATSDFFPQGRTSDMTCARARAEEQRGR